MFIAQAKLEYGWNKKMLDLFDKFPEKYRDLRSKVKLLELPNTREELVKMDHYSFRSPEKVVDDVELAVWTEAGFELMVERVRGVNTGSRDVHTQVYNIAVANVGLLQIQRVDILEDCETYQLQRELDGGARLLAVMPPNNTNWPSYVIGWFDKEPK